eukprot:TRINITY_DN77924_c0_g1_i1.p1 TRINITY_DN77924_c0_g1~~TRINITY_DN77924_c0_g1_i1.p1  ORF type:complete len:436 (-),score=57.03 TRINITY_DN77924_c0_g1_i1:16-1323(-)
MTRVVEALERASARSFAEIRSLFEATPYCLRVKERGALYSLRYDKGASDFRCPVVRQARGLVLEKDTQRIVSWAFDKFYEYGEDAPSYRDRPNLRRSIADPAARYERKYDGALIKVVRRDTEADGLLVSTNGCVDADEAPLHSRDGTNSCGRSLRAVFAEAGGLSLPYEAGLCYAFELLHPALTTVTPASGVALVHLLTRRLSPSADGALGDELPPEARFSVADVVQPPEVLTFLSFRACAGSARMLPWDDEGYVVADGSGRRIKVKSEAYRAMQRLIAGDSANLDDDSLAVALTLHRSSAPLPVGHIHDRVVAWRARAVAFAGVCARLLAVRPRGLAASSVSRPSARSARAALEVALGGRLPPRLRAAVVAALDVRVKTVCAKGANAAAGESAGQAAATASDAVLDALRGSRLGVGELRAALHCWDGGCVSVGG